MTDNSREGRESLTKKISFHDKNTRNYKTIESMQKDPTKKKITLNQYPFKKESHHLANPNTLSKHPDRKIKSLSKYEVKKLSESHKKRSALGNEPELATIEGLLNRNMQMIKFSMSKERDRIITKQKYKRSEQVRSLLDNKKMSSIGKHERRDTQNSSRALQAHKLADPEGVASHKVQFKQINLSTIINSSEGKEHEVTLEDAFEEGCYLYYQYLGQKQEKLAQVENLTTLHLKTIKEELNVLLQEANSKFKAIHAEVGEMSLKNLLMIAAVLFEQGKFNDVIMYIGRVLEKTDGDMFLIKLPGPNLKPSQTLTFLNSQSDESRHLNLNLLSYLNLAESYKNTNNFLCAINIINKCEVSLGRYLKKQSSLKHLKQHYQTLQPRESEQFMGRGQIKPAIKKKSYMLSSLRPQPTTNKFKKHSHNNSNNYSSIDLNKSKIQLESTHRNDPSLQERESEDDHANAKYASHKQSLYVLQEGSQQSNSEYIKQLSLLYLLLARLYIKIKSYDLAISSYNKCLEVNPRKIESLLELASLYYMKHSPKKSLEWLEGCLQMMEKQSTKDKRWQLDYSYIKYHKSLILLQENETNESYKIFNSIKSPELASEVNYYKGLIKLRKLNEDSNSLGLSERNDKVQSILMSLNQAITAFTSREYLIKSYFYILLILVFEKKDYYGAQYEVNRFKKFMPTKAELKEEERIGLSRISRIYEEEDLAERELMMGQSGVWGKDSYFNLLFDMVDGIICILKMKIGKGIHIFKQVSLKVESNSQDIIKHYGYYYHEIIKLLLQFKFYGYYILREYELALKHVNKLLDVLDKEAKKSKESPLEIKSRHNIERKLISINKLMLECIILMKQGKFNYAMSKLAEIETINQSTQTGSESAHMVSNAFILNNFNMVKSLCLMNLYTQLEHQKGSEHSKSVSQQTQQNNKQILLSAEELLRHCLISDKENSLIYYLISVIYYELGQYESSLKYIREALEFSDDHMIKHYFSKANTKFMLGRYDEAIKDYTNAIIVYKQQIKNGEGKQPAGGKKGHNPPKEDGEEEYYAEKQIMYNEIYLNRAITYIKHSYQLSSSRNYADHANIISSYKMKACEDLLKYFKSLADSKTTTSDKDIRNHLLLFLHTDDPAQMIEASKLVSGKGSPIGEEDVIKVYYSIKQLNNCILSMRTFISQIQHRLEQVERHRVRKESLPAKHKKISMTLPRKISELSAENLKLSQMRFDLRCLQSLKKSSSQSQGSLEEALISLLQMTEQIYRRREEQFQGGASLDDPQNLTLENMFAGSCGQIFKWSDILFFIGVIHFELKEYETAIKYFQESENQKRANNTLYSLSKYLNQVLKKGTSPEEEEEYLFYELQPIFENRVYCKEELDYNIGICYLMLGKYKQAYFYLQNYPHFLMIIKKAITLDKQANDNQFLTKQPNPKKKKEILIDDFQDSNRSTKRFQAKGGSGRQERLNHSNLSSLSESGISQKESQIDSYENITPFPTHNRLCSIYSPKVIDDKKFYLAFCLPKVELPLLGLFHSQQVDPAEHYSNEDQSSNSQSSRVKEEEEGVNRFPVEKRSFESVARHISLLDLEMKPIAPWIRQNTSGVIFTENIISESIQLNSERAQKRKGEEGREQGKKGKKERYTQYESKK